MNLEQCREMCSSGWPSNQREQARFDAAIEQKGGACKTCNGEGGWESAASSTSYFWTERPACVNTKGGA